MLARSIEGDFWGTVGVALHCLCSLELSYEAEDVGGVDWVWLEAVWFFYFVLGVFGRLFVIGGVFAIDVLRCGFFP